MTKTFPSEERYPASFVSRVTLILIHEGHEGHEEHKEHDPHRL